MDVSVKITDKIRSEYLDSPSTCPFCGSEHISANSLEESGLYIYRDIECYNPACRTRWQEQFKLINIQYAIKHYTNVSNNTGKK